MGNGAGTHPAEQQRRERQTGAVLAVLALYQASSAWLTVAGLAAAAGACLIALPRLRA
jgi:hypothetical protein